MIRAITDPSSTRYRASVRRADRRMVQPRGRRAREVEVKVRWPVRLCSGDGAWVSRVRSSQTRHGNLEQKQFLAIVASSRPYRLD